MTAGGGGGGEHARQGVRFLVLSAVSFTLNLGLTVGLARFAGLHPPTAFAIALATVFVVNFLIMRFFVYRAHRTPWWTQFARYAPSALLFRFAEQRVFSWVHDQAWVAYPLAVTAVLAASTVVKFFYWGAVVFTRPRPADPPL